MLEDIRRNFDKWEVGYGISAEDVEHLFSLIDKYKEERDSANRVSMASLEQVITSGTSLLHQEEVRKSIQKFERIKEEHQRYKEALEQARDKAQILTSHCAYAKGIGYNLDAGDTFEKSQAIYELLRDNLEEE